MSEKYDKSLESPLYCPYCLCDGDNLEIEYNGGHSRVKCSCGMTGPYAIDSNEYISNQNYKALAITAWNSIPRPPSFTNEKPNKEGWYWWRSERNEYIYLRKVYYVKFTKRWCVTSPLSSDGLINDNKSYEHLDDINPDSEWAGPILNPIESEICLESE